MDSPTKNTVSSRLSIVLNARPSKKGTWIYLSIIAGLSAHLFFLGIMYILTSDPEAQQTQKKQEIRLASFDLAFSPPEENKPVQDPLPSTLREEVRNLLANAASQRTGEQVNYTSKTQAEIEAEVVQNLKNLEQSEFESLKSGHQDFSIAEKDNSEKAGNDKKNTAKNHTIDSYKNIADKSFSGPVSAEYNLADRQVKFSPKPTYRCKSSGKVVIKISVDKTGIVTDATVDEKQTSGGDCIREESILYARKWKFDYKENAVKKQEGSITFIFSGQ